MPKTESEADAWVVLRLTRPERKFLSLEGPAELRELLEKSPASDPVQLTSKQMDVFVEYLSAASGQCKDVRQERRLNRLLDKVDEAIAESDLGVSGADEALNMLVQTKLMVAQAGVADDPLESIQLNLTQREALQAAPLADELRQKLADCDAPFTLGNVIDLLIATAQALNSGKPAGDSLLPAIQLNLLEQFQLALFRLSFGPPGRSQKAPSKPRNQQEAVAEACLFQFKVTLKHTHPPIWRRILVADCTLLEFHELIQGAMGWMNCHLYQFTIGGRDYGDPEQLQDLSVQDASQVLLSDVLPDAEGKRFAFRYVYDFGDDWLHEVRFEGRKPLPSGPPLPCCVTGKRACPPEDCGGPWGYGELLEALADPTDPRHEELREWSGELAPEDFDPVAATRRMQS